jgi:hypothetical protein
MPGQDKATEGRHHVVADDGQPGEIGRLVHAGDHRGQRQVEVGGELGHGGGLSDPRLAPQQYRQVGHDRQHQCGQLRIGAGFGGGVTQQRE